MTEDQWVQAVRARGWENAVSAALDVLEPLGPLGAQALWIAQPAARLIASLHPQGIGGWGDTLGALALALEQPGGIERLRQALNADDAAEIDEDKF